MMRGASSGEVGSVIPSWITPERVLLGGMFLSAILVFTLGRNLSFTEDEVLFISRAGSLSPGDLFEPYVGHLVAIPLLAYWILLNLFGPGEYALFQGLTLGSIFLLAWLLFLWGGKRVPPWVAVAPCLLILIFPQDILHYLFGNGFVIVFALACGLGALLMFESNTRGGDLAAFTLLVVGMMTYTVAAPFALGVLAAAVVTRRWERLWVGALPLALYAMWRLFASSYGIAGPDVQPDFINLLLTPAWSFQALGGSLISLLGGGFGFAPIERGDLTIAEGMAGVFGTLLLLATAISVYRKHRSPWLIVISLIAVSLFASQLLVWGTRDVARAGPLEPRYLYPGALVVIMLGLELVRKVDWSKQALVIIWVVVVLASLSSIGKLVNGDRREIATKKPGAELLAIALLDSTDVEVPATDQPRRFTPQGVDLSGANDFGYLGFTEEELLSEPPKIRLLVDEFLISSLRLRLRTVGQGTEPRSCRRIGKRGGRPPERVSLPARGAILSSARTISLKLGRYGIRGQEAIGAVGPDKDVILRLKQDDGSVPWFITAEPGTPGDLTDLVVCRYRKAS